MFSNLPKNTHILQPNITIFCCVRWYLVCCGTPQCNIDKHVIRCPPKQYLVVASQILVPAMQHICLYVFVYGFQTHLMTNPNSECNFASFMQPRRLAGPTVCWQELHNSVNAEFCLQWCCSHFDEIPCSSTARGHASHGPAPNYIIVNQGINVLTVDDGHADKPCEQQMHLLWLWWFPPMAGILVAACVMFVLCYVVFSGVAESWNLIIFLY